MTNIQAAIGVAQLENLDKFIERKNKFHEIYIREFKDFKYGKILGFRDNTLSNKWFLSLCIDIESIGCELRDLIEELKTKGVETRPIWGLIHMQKPYKNDIAYNMDRSLYYYKRVLNIPSSTQLTEDDIVSAAKIIKNVIMEHIK